VKNRKIWFALAAFLILAVGTKIFLQAIYVPPILMYHYIDDKEDMSKLSLCPEGFSRQMKFLREHKYNVVSLEELVGMIKNKKKIPPKTVAVTFDDGMRNNFLCAYPVLKQYNIPATFFVPTNFVGTADYMTWDELKAMDGSLITIGSHTKSHLMLPYLSDEQIKDEIYGSKKTLEENLARPVTIFSYPVGSYNDKIKQLVIDAGYEAAAATNPGPGKAWNDIYALKRIRISRTSNNLFIFWIETSGYYTFIKEKRDTP